MSAASERAAMIAHLRELAKAKRGWAANEMRKARELCLHDLTEDSSANHHLGVALDLLSSAATLSDVADRFEQSHHRGGPVKPADQDPTLAFVRAFDALTADLALCDGDTLLDMIEARLALADAGVPVYEEAK